VEIRNQIGRFSSIMNLIATGHFEKKNKNKKIKKEVSISRGANEGRT
jgi:hypothetical protein